MRLPHFANPVKGLIHWATLESYLAQRKQYLKYVKM